MTINDYVAYIKLMLTGSVLTLEVTDDTLKEVVKAALREVNRYIDQTKFMTIPYAKCIDLTGSNVSSVTAVYRTKGYLSANDDSDENPGDVDPFQATIWKVFSNNGSMYNLNDYVLNYASFATMLSLRSAQSTDLSFKMDMTTKKLYINTSNDVPTSITIEYVPKLIDAEDVVSDYWIDIMQRLCLGREHHADGDAVGHIGQEEYGLQRFAQHFDAVQGHGHQQGQQGGDGYGDHAQQHGVFKAYQKVLILGYLDEVAETGPEGGFPAAGQGNAVILQKGHPHRFDDGPHGEHQQQYDGRGQIQPGFPLLFAFYHTHFTSK